MAAHTGVLSKLKDRATSVPDKVQLAKLTWVTPSVDLPNKQQALLDLVCGLLVNKNKHNLTAKDAVSVWQTLLKFLKAADKSVVVRPSILQAITEYLGHSSKTDTAPLEDGLTVTVVSCTLNLLLFTSVTIGQFDTLCKLLGSVLQATSRHAGSSVGAVISSLVDPLVKVLAVEQRTHLNQNQVLQVAVDKLLPPFLDTLSGPSLTHDDGLTHLLVCCLLSMDHSEAYETYLKSLNLEGETKDQQTNKPTNKQTNKHIVKLFSTLTSALKKGCDSVAFKFLPEFQKYFVVQNRSEPSSCLLMLRHLVSLLGDLDPPRPRDPVTPDLWLRGVAGLVSACEGCPLLQGEGLSWGCQLTSAALDMERGPAWFVFLRSVLGQNHLIVEKNLSAILTRGLTHCGELEQSVRDEQDEFLAHLVSMFIKLRRVPDLVDGLTAAAMDKGGKADGASVRQVGGVMEGLPSFYSSLCAMVQDLPATTLLEVWGQLHSTAVACLASSPPSVCGWVLRLYWTLLDNASMFDHRIPGVVVEKVQGFTARLEGEGLLPYATKYKDCKEFTRLASVLSVFKSLLETHWGAGASDDLGTEGGKLMKVIDPRSKLVTSLHSQSFSVGEGQVVDMVEGWSRAQLDQKSPTSQHEAAQKFREFSHMFPLISHRLTPTALARCAKFVVHVMSQSPDTTSTPSHNLQAEVQTFLRHPAVKECAGLQMHLCVSVWAAVLSSPAPPKTKKKTPKKASKPSPDGDTDIAELVAFVTDVDAELSGRLLTFEKLKGAAPQCQIPGALMQVLAELPLEYLPNVNLRCQLGLICTISNLEECQENMEVLQSLQSLLIRSLSVSNLSTLFQSFHSHQLIDFGVWFVAQKMGVAGHPLLDLCVEAVLRDRQAALGLPSYVKQFVAPLKSGTQGFSVVYWTETLSPSKIDQGMSVHMMTAAYLVKHCHKYLSHHVPELRQAAVDIVFTVAKAVVKNIQLWGESPSKKCKKKKRDSSVGGDMPHKSLYDNLEMWVATLTCLGEVMFVWSPGAADEAANHSLGTVARETIGHIIQTLKAGSCITGATQAELRFLRQCCRCHLRCQADRESLAKPDSESNSTDETEESEKEGEKHDFSLFASDDLRDLWMLLLPSAESQISRMVARHSTQKTSQLKSAVENVMILGSQNMVEQNNDNAKKKRQSDLEVATPRKKKRRMENSKSDPEKMETSSHDSSSQVTDKSRQDNRVASEALSELPVNLAQLSSWPPSLSQWVDTLTVVMETCHVDLFSQLMAELLAKMNPAAPLPASMTYTLVAVWRGLVTSQHLAPASNKVFFSQIYQSLASLLYLVQDLDARHQTTTVARLAPSCGDPSGSPAAVTGFVVDALTDFINLGKSSVTPRMTLLCLHAGLTFTLTSASEVMTLQRLVNSVMTYHTNTALTAVPSLMQLINKLLTACLTLGSEKRLNQSPGELSSVQEAAHSVTRLLLQLSGPNYRQEVAKVVHSVIAEYIVGLQKGGVATSVKRELTRGIYKVMGVSDKYRLAALNAALSPGGKDIFRQLHQDWKKYHQYKGTV